MVKIVKELPDGERTGLGVTSSRPTDAIDLPSGSFVTEKDLEFLEKELTRRGNLKVTVVNKAAPAPKTPARPSLLLKFQRLCYDFMDDFVLEYMFPIFGVIAVLLVIVGIMVGIGRLGERDYVINHAPKTVLAVQKDKALLAPIIDGKVSRNESGLYDNKILPNLKPGDVVETDPNSKLIIGRALETSGTGGR